MVMVQDERRAHMGNLPGLTARASHSRAARRRHGIARDYGALQAILRGRMRAADLRLWAQKWRWYERNSLPWNRARIHWELAARQAFCRWPLHGNVLEMLREGRLELGPHVLFEPGVWLTSPAPGRIRIGAGTFLNLGVQIAAVELVEIGAHCMFANGCFVTDGNHRFDDAERPVPWQGFTTKGPTRIGDNVWCGANVVDHERRDGRRALRDRRQLGGHARSAAVLDRRRRPRAGAGAGRYFLACRARRTRRRRRRPRASAPTRPP